MPTHSPDALESQIGAAISRGDITSAIGLLEQLIAKRPDDVEACAFLAGLYRDVGRMRDSLLLCDRTIAAAPGYTEAWLQKAYTMAASGIFSSARSCCERAIQLAPQRSDARATLANLAAVQGDLDLARREAEKALHADPANLTAAAALAQCAIEAKDGPAALPVLQRALAMSPEGGAPRINALNLLGDLYDRAQMFGDAFAAYAQSKQLFRTLFRDRFGDHLPAQRLLIERITDGLSQADVTNWAIPADDGVDRHAIEKHCFLLGYPRSGTTLVENILASSPDVVALEERPTLRQADEHFLLPDDGMAALAALDHDGARDFRQRYWTHVHAALPSHGSIFVDMDPLKGSRLPIIARLFTDAKILIMRRDPREVIWSCFHTNFAMSSAAYDFADMTDAARHYDAMMRLIALSCERLPLQTMDLRYDRLVTDFDNTTRDICAFMDLEWTEQLQRFDRTARQRGVATASAAQVRKGLYDGRKQWQPYADMLKPAFDIIAPWVDKLGFL